MPSLTTSLSPELAMLAACDLADDAGLAARIDAAGPAFDWGRLAALASGNQMGAIVSARLAQLAPPGPEGDGPRAAAAELSGYLQASAVLCLAQTHATHGVVRLLREAGVPSLVLKGMALSHLLYPDAPHLRASSDIDVLIDDADLAQAGRALHAAGWRRKWPETDPPARGQGMFLLLANVFDYVHPVSGQLLELHFRPTLNPAWLPTRFADLRAEAVSVATPRGELETIGGARLVAYLCWHSFAHAGFRMKWFCDVARALRLTGASGCARLCPAEAGFAQGPLELADALAATIAHALDPASPAPTGAHAAEVRRIVADMEAPHELPTGRTLATLGAELRFRRFLVGLSPGWRGKAYEVLRATADPRDVRVLRLGPAFAPLYVLAGPFLALGRLVVRSRHGNDAVPSADSVANC